MTAKHATRNAILTYIGLVPFPRPRAKVIEHMRKSFGTKPHATREQLRRLCRDGAIEQTEPGFYGIAGA